MNEETLREVLRNPACSRPWRMAAYRAIVDNLASGLTWQKAISRMDDLSDGAFSRGVLRRCSYLAR